MTMTGALGCSSSWHTVEHMSGNNSTLVLSSSQPGKQEKRTCSQLAIDKSRALIFAMTAEKMLRHTFVDQPSSSAVSRYAQG